MLELDDPKWSQLVHAYGPASDTPALLKQLETMPATDDESGPWFSLWSSLAHQGDVYSASFAAVPHVVRILEQAPLKADFSFFDFPAWVEICRQKKAVAVPPELEADYFQALQKIPSLVAAASGSQWEEGFLLCALAAIAAVKGYGTIAEAVLELNGETAEKFLGWVFEQ